jgi:hypothetical protein
MPQRAKQRTQSSKIIQHPTENASTAIFVPAPGAKAKNNPDISRWEDDGGPADKRDPLPPHLADKKIPRLVDVDHRSQA